MGGYAVDANGAISIHSPRAGRDLEESRRFPTLPYFNPLAPCGARHTTLKTLDYLEKISIHSPRAGRDTVAAAAAGGSFVDFNPLAPCGARLLSMIGLSRVCSHFNPLAPCGARPSRRSFIELLHLISIHSPRAGRDAEPRVIAAGIDGISIHSPRAGRDKRLLQHHGYGSISIHSPRAGRDVSSKSKVGERINFNPLAPCGARPCPGDPIKVVYAPFQSTRPVRGETIGVISIDNQWVNFNPLAPCGARLRGDFDRSTGKYISIHSPRAGRDNQDRTHG